ncbi:chaperonin 10-like protein [Dactylonectria estremocensis]|uniref:Chaperonin 10-like protein n=1 Tax=Dactylonectria estremocensis TaxID=1079267 RepID=A0A9P9EUF9_9HYPO|nr:chaperonin 10-like protein [Dactylonectria estremocensis]
MLAAVVERFGQPYTMKQIPRPSPPEGHDILIKVLAASYCHTDAVFSSGSLSKELPRIGCHEFAGEVLALGPEVSSNRGIAPGVRVGVPGRAYHPCGTCHECTHPGQDEMGYSPYCPRAGNLGLTRDGGFQEYCLVDSRQVAPLPEGLSATQAAPLMCAGLTIWAALHHEKMQCAERVAIIGAGGGLGHLGVQFAAHLGRQVLAIDANDQSLELVQRIRNNLGSSGSRVHVADARNTEIDEMRLMGQEAYSGAPPTEVGLDAVILLPESQRAFDMGMKLLRNHGTMVVVSFPKEKLAVSAHDLVFRDISVVGSLVGRNHQLREMLDFAMRHGVSAEIKTFPFHELNELVKKNHQGVGGKLVIDMTL